MMATESTSTEDLAAGADMDIDSEILAGLEAMEAAERGEPEKEDVKAEDAEDAAPEADSDAETSDEKPQDATDSTEDPPADEQDAIRDKRLEAIQQAEERSKASVDEYRTKAEEAIAAREAQFAEMEAEYSEFDSLKSEAKYDPAKVLMALGLDAGSLEAAARQIFVASQGESADPKVRDAANRVLRERKQSDDVSALRAELEDLKKQNADRDKQEKEREEQKAVEEQIGLYVDKVAKAASDETPLVKAMMESNAVKTRQKLYEIANSLGEKTGEVPDPSDVVKALEQERRSELKELGIDPDVALKANPKNSNTDAGETKAAKTMSNQLGTPTRPQNEPMTDEELHEEIIRELKAMESKDL